MIQPTWQSSEHNRVRPNDDEIVPIFIMVLDYNIILDIIHIVKVSSLQVSVGLKDLELQTKEQAARQLDVFIGA